MSDTLSKAIQLCDQEKYEEGIPIILKLATDGYAPAQCHMGILYQDGRGVPLDWQEAERWFLLAITQGNRDSIVNLASMYLKGRKSFPHNRKRAIELFKQSALLGSPTSQHNLGHFFLEGKYDLCRDIDEAMKWYRMYLTNGEKTPGKLHTLREIKQHLTTDMLLEILISEYRLREQVESDKKRISELEEEVEQLKTELEYRPDGSGYD